MTGKTGIAERLGERGVLLPSLLSEALQANDRIKLRFSMLQEAMSQARNPREHPSTFGAERQQAGLVEPQFDTLISGAHAAGANKAVIPGAATLLAALHTDLAAMLAPIETAEPNDAKLFSSRLNTLSKAVPVADGDTVSAAEIGAITSARREAGDSLHLLVMDMHKAINRISAATAPETIDGAKAHCVTAEDRSRIKAFMQGLNRTKALAFGHPGLGTTAVRTGTSLTIQNDIGTTDAHVLVAHVDGQTVTVTYTDVHRPRAKFFVALFAGQGMEFGPLTEHDSEGLGTDDVFYLLTGRFTGSDEASLTEFLKFLGSRIVFLIDWNKARKALQIFTGKDAAVDLLTYAAVNDLGHRAFLELGGADLVFEAIRRVAEGRIPYGARLDDVLGHEATQDFLRNVLRQTSVGLAAGRSGRLIRDEIQADLSQRFETAEATLLMLIVRHLGLSRMLAGWLNETLSNGGIARAVDREHLAACATKLEKKADHLTLSAREIAVRLSDNGNLLRLIDAVENTMDTLDECAFFISLAPETEGADAVAPPLSNLARLTLEAVSHLVRAMEAAVQLPLGRRVDAMDSLQSIDAVLDAEHRADAAERDAMRACVGAARLDARSLVLGLEVARTLETATDHLAHAALSLRDRVLEELSA